MDMYNYVVLDFNELYYGVGLDEDLTPEEFVQQLHEAVDMWLDDEGPYALNVYNDVEKE